MAEIKEAAYDHDIIARAIRRTGIFAEKQIDLEIKNNINSISLHETLQERVKRDMMRQKIREIRDFNVAHQESNRLNNLLNKNKENNESKWVKEHENIIRFKK